jgi:lipid A 3-O-deacylase
MRAAVKRTCTLALLVLASFVCSSAPADAATAENNPEAVKLFSLRFGSVSIYTENDKYFAGTDQHYTNGFKMSALSTDLRSFKDRDVPRVLRNIARQVDNFIEPEREPKLGLSFGQNIYTPTDIETTAYQPDDRPYAAWLYLGAAFHNYRPAYTRENGSRGPARADVFEINLGAVGPVAIGRQVQNLVHETLDIATAKGWANQINNEPGLNLIYEAKWRFSTANARDGWGADLLPHWGVCLGNVFTYASVGAEVRLGYSLPDDFGTSLIRPSGESNSRHRARYNFFVFAGIDGRAVARDITLDGNTWRDSPSIDKKPFVYDVVGGFGFGFTHWQITYTQARRSVEFEGQPEPQDFGSLSVSYFF